jgi:hypothetical protein
VSHQHLARKPATARSARTELVRSVFRPRTASEVARLRRGEITLAGLSPGPMVLAFLSVGAKTGASTLAALVAQFLAAMAPGQVAMLDGDGEKSVQRIRLGADGAGDLKALLASPEAWRSRRAIDRYVAHGGRVPLLAPAVDEPWPIPDDRLAVAIRLLRHRYPCVMVDLPAIGTEVAARNADQVVVVGRLNESLQSTCRWLVANRPGRDPRSVLTATVGVRSRGRVPSYVDVAIPMDEALSPLRATNLSQLALPTRAAVEEVVCQLSITWATPATMAGVPVART